MANIFFKRLEKRFSTQSVIPWYGVPSLENLETLIGKSITNQSKIFSQPITNNPSVYYYNNYAPHFMPWSNMNSSLLSSYNPLGSWGNNQPASWNHSLSSWLYARFPTVLMPSSWNYPLSSLNTYLSPQASPVNSSIQTSNSPFGGMTSPYPPGTRYGLIKRANLKS